MSWELSRENNNLSLRPLEFHTFIYKYTQVPEGSVMSWADFYTFSTTWHQQHSEINDPLRFMVRSSRGKKKKKPEIVYRMFHSSARR